MMKDPQDARQQKHPASESAAAVDDVRTKQELAAAEAKRHAEADLAASHRAGSGVPHSAKSHPKVHRNEEEEPIEDTSGEPVIEDEP